MRDFHQALSAFVAPRLQRSRDRKGLTDALAFVSLLKRSMSTIAACLATLRVVEERYGSEPQLRRTAKSIAAPIAGGGSFRRAGTQRRRRRSPTWKPRRWPPIWQARNCRTFMTLIRLGEAAAAHDPKLAALVLEIRLIRLRHPDANILVYTEYADSQRAAVEALAGIGGTF